LHGGELRGPNSDRHDPSFAACLSKRSTKRFFGPIAVGTLGSALEYDPRRFGGVHEFLRSQMAGDALTLLDRVSWRRTGRHDAAPASPTEPSKNPSNP